MTSQSAHFRVGPCLLTLLLLSSGCATLPAEYASLPPAIAPIAQQAAAGDPAAEVKLGNLYMSGQAGVPRNAAQAMKLFQSASDKGNAIAANNIGVMYSNGIGVPQNFGEAKKWFELAGQRGNTAGTYNLGMAYLKGQGTASDPATAAQYLREAADKNNAMAKFALAMMYQKGTGVPQDDTEATRLVHSAAVSGYGPAQVSMAGNYSVGRGVEPDDGLSYEWASLASSTPRERCPRLHVEHAMKPPST